MTTAIYINVVMIIKQSKLLQINLKTKMTETVAGTGRQGSDKEGGERLGKEQSLASPWDVCLTSLPGLHEESDMLLIANAGTHQIWGLALKNLTWWKTHRLEAGRCVRIAGSGAEENRNNCYPAKAAFAQPSGLCRGGDIIFVADSESSSIRQMSLKDGAVKSLVGGDRDPSVGSDFAAHLPWLVKVEQLKNSSIKITNRLSLI